jgi:hypothetical protein
MAGEPSHSPNGAGLRSRIRSLGDYPGDMTEEERTGLSVIDKMLLVGGGIIVVFVLFGLLHIIVGAIWFLIKVVVAVAVIVFLARWIFSRK